MTLNKTILKKLNNFKIFILDLIPIASNNTPQSDTTTGSSGSSLEYARADHVHPIDTSRASSTHTHGSISNTGTLNSNTTTVSKVVVTDSNNNIKTINQLPVNKIDSYDRNTGMHVWNMEYNSTKCSLLGDVLIYDYEESKIFVGDDLDPSNELAVKGDVNSRAPNNHAHQITDVSDVETVPLTITYTDDSTQTLDFIVKK